MADNMCGPSNAAKGLLSHIDRDRSLQQDRLAGPGQRRDNASFRTQLAPYSPADSAFEAFQRGSDVLSPAMAAMTLNHGTHISQTTSPLVASRSPLQTQGLGTASAQTSIDAASFHRFLSQSQTNCAGAALPNTTSLITPHHNVPVPSMSQLPQAGVGHGGFQGGFGGPRVDTLPGPSAFPGNIGQAMIRSEVSKAVAPPETFEQRILDEAFSAAFGEYDEEDFNREVDAWITEHGSEQEQIPQRAAEPPTAEEMAVIDANLEVLAQELEERRAAGDPEVLPQRGPEAEARQAKQEQEDLIRAATDILASVSDNQTQKFKNSSFLHLMRRIQLSEVVVAGNDLVDSKTGKTIASEET
ncbi:hypothetical protein VTK73DRAFT_5379 [Phialemonium thermophilum]|uniref:Peroxin 20 n=1 Tax=Phialemonium thermophilum TaxID=223376 RepID=A0ABR3XXW0_9PEZI